jgi:hypothetical protein
MEETKSKEESAISNPIGTIEQKKGMFEISGKIQTYL